MDCSDEGEVYIKKYLVTNSYVGVLEKQSIHSDASHPHWVFHTSDKICLNMPCVSLVRCAGQEKSAWSVKDLSS